MKKLTKIVMAVLISLAVVLGVMIGLNLNIDLNTDSDGKSNADTTTTTTTATHICEFGEWITVKNPTSTEEGAKERKCACGKKETLSIPKVIMPSEGLAFELNEDGVSYSVTGIGTCTDTDIVIPSAYNDLPVTCIGDWAFDVCGSSLTSVTIPDSITSIGVAAFRDCELLTSLIIPDSVTAIGSEAFYGCELLTGIEIPDSVVSIGDAAFGNCSSLISINVSAENQHYVSVDGNLYTRNMSTLIQYLIVKTDRAFTIPDSVTRIADSAFAYCDSLTTIIIPEGVTSIGSSAFQFCSSLVSVTIPYSVTHIGYQPFEYCYSLIEVCNKSTFRITTDYYGYAGIGRYAKHIITDESESAIRYIGDYIFFDDGENVYLVKYIGNDSELTLPYYYGRKDYGIWNKAFYYNDKIISVTIPDCVTSMADEAFRNCDSLKSVYITDLVAWCNIDFAGSMTTFSSNPLWNKGADLYLNGELVTELVIPDSVSRISEKSFLNCDSLISVIIPDSVTSIGRDAFSGCDSLRSVTIGDSVTSIGTQAFYDCDSLMSIIVSENNNQYKSIDGNLYSKDGETLIQYSIGKTNTSFTIPDGVTAIGEYAFYNCDSLTSLVIPKSVNRIVSNLVFSNCDSLTIYCEANSKPYGWNDYWNDNLPVVWGYTGE